MPVSDAPGETDAAGDTSGSAGLCFLLPADLALPGDGMQPVNVSTCTAILGETLWDLLELEARPRGRLPTTK